MSDLREALGHAIAYLIRPDAPPLSPDQRAKIANHLRRFLALTETGQRVKWCDVHLSGEIADHCELEQCLAAKHYEKPQPCRIVSKFLADYLTEEGP